MQMFPKKTQGVLWSELLFTRKHRSLAANLRFVLLALSLERFLQTDELVLALVSQLLHRRRRVERVLQLRLQRLQLLTGGKPKTSVSSSHFYAISILQTNMHTARLLHELCASCNFMSMTRYIDVLCYSSPKISLLFLGFVSRLFLRLQILLYVLQLTLDLSNLLLECRSARHFLLHSTIKLHNKTVPESHQACQKPLVKNKSLTVALYTSTQYLHDV